MIDSRKEFIQNIVKPLPWVSNEKTHLEREETKTNNKKIFASVQNLKKTNGKEQ